MTNQERERPAYSTVEDCPEQLKKELALEVVTESKKAYG